MKLQTVTIWQRWSVISIATVLFFSFQFAQAANISVESVVDLTNQVRMKEGLAPLVLNEKLVRSAMDKAADMLAHDYFAHTSPAGVTPWDWISRNKYDYKYAGENLAMGFAKAETQQQAWMNSPTHRQNILNAHYQEIGVAVAQGEIAGQATTIAVQEFGSRADFMAPLKKTTESAVPQPKNAAVLGAEQKPETGTIGMGAFAGFMKTVEGGFKNMIAKTSKLDWHQTLGAGAVGSLWLAILGGLSVAGYLAVDSLVVAYLRRRKQQADLAAVHLRSAAEELDILQKLSIDTSQLQTIYLQQLKARR
ncbi:MAG: CAP domain-containing protein [Parcubacteria group bacterium]|jgi:hypothetical protein